MVIGLGGYAQSGKDTLFSLLQKYGTKEYRRYAFADALKAEIAPRIKEDFDFDLFNCTPEQKSSIRHLMVELGAKRRAENPLYWVDKVGTSIMYDQFKGCKFIPVVTDVRYINEFQYLKRHFVENKTIAINRFGYSAANEEESKNTSLLYSEPEIIQFSWSDIVNYSERDLGELIGSLEHQIFNS